MSNAGSEIVLGIPRSSILGAAAWHGILDEGLQPYLALLEAKAEARPRPEAEQDPEWKQIIPYLLLRDGERIFLMRRTRAGGDARLHERWSIGIGGHLNPDDGDVRGGLLREFQEEMVADWLPELQLMGLLNDDSTLVGQVHLGIVFSADAKGREISVRETEKLNGAFATSTEVQAVYQHLETWSQIVFDFITTTADTMRDR